MTDPATLRQQVDDWLFNCGELSLFDSVASLVRDLLARVTQLEKMLAEKEENLSRVDGDTQVQPTGATAQSALGDAPPDDEYEYTPEEIAQLNKDFNAMKARHEAKEQALSDAPALRRQLQEAEAESTRLRAQLEQAQALNEYFRDAVGECHLMISRNTSEYQIRREWEPTDLPPRLQIVMQRAEKAEADLTALHTTEPCEKAY